MTEELLVELHAVHDLGRELASSGVTTPIEWARYREWRDRVLTEVSQTAAA